MSRLLFAFPVIAALAITPSSALAQHHHGVSVRPNHPCRAW